MSCIPNAATDRRDVRLAEPARAMLLEGSEHLDGGRGRAAALDDAEQVDARRVRAIVMSMDIEEAHAVEGVQVMK